jgi:hypothetical protein
LFFLLFHYGSAEQQELEATNWTPLCDKMRDVVGAELILANENEKGDFRFCPDQ